MDYAILMDFNTLMRRYCPAINSTVKSVYDEHIPGPNGEQTAKLMHPNLPIDPITNWRGLPYVTTDKHGVRLEYRRVNNPVFTRQNGANEKDDLIDQLMYIDMQQKLIRDSESSFASSTNYFTPEYRERSERYQNIDMKTFFNRVLDTNETDSKGFDSIQIGNINRVVGTEPDPNVKKPDDKNWQDDPAYADPPPPKVIEPSYPPIPVPCGAGSAALGYVQDYDSGVVTMTYQAMLDRWNRYNEYCRSQDIPALDYSVFNERFRARLKQDGKTLNLKAQL
jgi:hypothetical protein